MADQTSTIKINIETSAGGKSLSDLKNEFKETQKTLQGLDTSSKEYIKTLEKLGGIKDDIGDLNDEIKAFNPEGKVQAFGNVIGGLASGFQAAQGAAALFGAEGEELQKTLLKVQAASAFADGIKGVMGIGDAFKVLGNIIKANPLILIASIVIAIGVALFELKDKIAIVGKAFDAIGEVINKTIQGFKDLTDWMGITSNAADDLAKKQIELAEKVGKATQDRYDKEIAIAKASGKETIDIEIKKQAALVASLQAQKKDFKEAQDQLLYLTIQRNTKIADENSEANKKYLADLEARNKKEHDINEAFFLSKFNGREKEEAEKRELANKEVEFKQGALLEEVDFETDTKKNQTDLINAYVIEQEKLTADEKLKITKESLGAAQALSDAVFAIRLSNVQKGSKEEQKILEKQFNINKAFQVATATMNGIQAIQSILAQYPKFDGGIAMVAALAATSVTTVANIAKIAATKFNSSGGGSGGSSSGSLSSASGGVAIAPPTNGSTSLNADGTIKGKEKVETPVVKAIVTETDITKTQFKVSSIQQQSKLA